MAMATSHRLTAATIGATTIMGTASAGRVTRGSKMSRTAAMPGKWMTAMERTSIGGDSPRSARLREPPVTMARPLITRPATSDAATRPTFHSTCPRTT